MKINFILLSIFVCFAISCIKNVNKNEDMNIEVENSNMINFGEHNIGNDNTMYINDIYIEDFKFIVANVSLNHDQFTTKNVWDKKICSPILDTEYKLRYRTIINNAAKMEPDFDGKYKIITFGGGSGVTAYFILDLNTGIVYEPNSHSYFGMEYNVNSKLLIINPPQEIIDYWGYGYEDNIIPGWVQVEYLIILNGKIKTLLLINPIM
jgi:hypothetical protein